MTTEGFNVLFTIRCQINLVETKTTTILSAISGLKHKYSLHPLHLLDTVEVPPVFNFKQFP